MTMLIGGAINLDEEEESKSATSFTGAQCWQFNEGTKWTFYPPSISALIERQWKDQKNIPQHSQKYIPIFWCHDTGERYKINIDLQVQFDIQNDSMVQIRRHPSAPHPVAYPKCPKCRFKISLDATICEICGIKLQPQIQRIQNTKNNKNDVSIPPVAAQPIPKPMDNDIEMIGNGNDSNHILSPVVEEPEVKNPFLAEFCSFSCSLLCSLFANTLIIRVCTF